MAGQLLTRKELAEKFDVSTNVIAKLIEQGMPQKNGKFDLKEVVTWRKKITKKALVNLEVGRVYTNEEITSDFLCSPQGGMRRSHKTNTLVLFTDHTGKNVYEDKWVNGVLQYTGMGLTGDQVLEGNQNKIVANSDSNYVQLYLFETFKAKEHTYAGQVVLSDAPYTVNEIDQNDKIRLVYKFPLAMVEKRQPIAEEIIVENKKRLAKKIDRLPKDELVEKAKKISKLNEASHKKNEREYRLTTTKQFIRNPHISAHVKELANGICQLCNQPAPFKKDDIPFLHSHHINYLSNGGTDTIGNCIAVCPNCHARIHELENSQDKQKLLQVVAQRKTK